MFSSNFKTVEITHRSFINRCDRHSEIMIASWYVSACIGEKTLVREYL